MQGLCLLSWEAWPLRGAELAGDRQAVWFPYYTTTVRERASGDHGTPDGHPFPGCSSAAVGFHRPGRGWLSAGAKFWVQVFPGDVVLLAGGGQFHFPHEWCKEGSGPPLGAQSMQGKGIAL